MCAVVGKRGLRNRLRIETLLIAFFMVAFFANAAYAQGAVNFDDVKATSFIRYALTQGGFFGGWMVTLWFYRRDFQAKSHEKSLQIDALLKIVAEEAASRQLVIASNEKLVSAVHLLAGRGMAS